MAEVFALPLLYDAVKAQFAAATPPLTTQFAFGRKEPAKQLNQGPGGANRIVFSPGDKAGKFAKDRAASKPWRDPRSLATKDEYFTVYIWASDASAPNDERKQYTAARLLYDAWRAAIHYATHTDGDAGLGPVTLIDEQWNVSKLESQFGYEIIAVCSIEAMVPDVFADDQLLDPPFNSNTTVTELDQSVVVHT